MARVWADSLGSVVSSNLYDNQVNMSNYIQQLQNIQRCSAMPNYPSFQEGLGQVGLGLGQFHSREYDCCERIKNSVDRIKRVVEEEIEVF